MGFVLFHFKRVYNLLRLGVAKTLLKAFDYMENSRGLILIAQVEGASWSPLLPIEGYRVQQVSDPLMLLSESQRLKPKLIIIDAALPGDTYALCARLCEVSRIPVLMFIPADAQAVERAYQAGAADVLTQPILPAMLLRRISILLQASEQAYPEDSEHRRLGEALRNTAAALSSTLDQNELLDRILEQINTVVPSESANVMLIEAGVAYVARARGYADRANRIPVDMLRLTVQETPSLRWMIENNRALAIPNTDNFTDWVKLDETDPWLKSYVAAPIRFGKSIIGFLNIDSSEPYAFSENDAANLQIFADQSAIAIRNARLFDHVLREASELERRVSERTADLDYERRQMRAIIDAMTEGVAYTEYHANTYRTRYVNQALTQMTGYTSEDWRNHSLHLFRTKGMTDSQFAQLEQEVAEALRNTGYWRQDLRLMRKDGTDFDAVTITSRVDNVNREIVGLVTVIRDVSREKALEQQKERFVAYASHELRTPITNLKTRLYLMQRQPERLDEHVQVLEYVTDRMKRLVEDLLDISRFERGVIKLDYDEIVLQELIFTIVDVQLPEAERKQINLSCDMPKREVRIRADSERLAQVITNLLSNAINYTPNDGSIVIRLRVENNRAVVDVEDTGVGISEDHLPHIFQPFYRVVSQVEGSGLGLSITQEIIELHGGEIKVTSQPGFGSIFRFWLPLPSAQTPEV